MQINNDIFLHLINHINRSLGLWGWLQVILYIAHTLHHKFGILCEWNKKKYVCKDRGRYAVLDSNAAWEDNPFL